jgi:hypothetical protein
VAVAGGSEIAAERQRRAAFGPDEFTGHGTPDPHPRRHSRFAGDRGSIPAAIPDLPGIGDHPHPRFPSGVPCPATKIPLAKLPPISGQKFIFKRT